MYGSYTKIGRGNREGTTTDEFTSETTNKLKLDQKCDSICVLESTDFDQHFRVN